MMQKYKAIHGYYFEIAVVEVDRETESCVWVSGRRYPKITAGVSFHDTWDGAHAHISSIAERKVEICRRNLERAKSVAGNVRGMKRPTDQSS